MKKAIMAGMVLMCLCAAAAGAIDNARSITARQVVPSPKPSAASSAVRCAVQFNAAVASCPQGPSAGIAWSVCAQYKPANDLIRCILSTQGLGDNANLLPQNQYACTDGKGCDDTCDAQINTYCSSQCVGLPYDQKRACDAGCLTQHNNCYDWCAANC